MNEKRIQSAQLAAGESGACFCEVDRAERQVPEGPLEPGEPWRGKCQWLERVRTEDKANSVLEGSLRPRKTVPTNDVGTC